MTYIPDMTERYPEGIGGERPYDDYYVEYDPEALYEYESPTSEQITKVFDTEALAIEYGKLHLDDKETEIVEIKCEKIRPERVLLCGTTKIEDEMDVALSKVLKSAIAQTVDIYVINEDIFYDYDMLGPLKSVLWDQILKIAGIKKVIFVNDEY